MNARIKEQIANTTCEQCTVNTPVVRRGCDDKEVSDAPVTTPRWGASVSVSVLASRSSRGAITRAQLGVAVTLSGLLK